MNKRGQLTLFVIISIVLVSILLIYFSFKEGLIGVSVAPEIEPVYSFVENCVASVSENAVYHIGQYGGYYIPTEKSSEGNFAYYYDKGQNFMPSKEKVEEELSKYVNNELFFCTQNFASFPDFEVLADEVTSEASIIKDKVVFKINYPLSIKKGETSYTINSFYNEVSSRLFDIYETAFKVIEQQMVDGDNICVNCISELSLEKEIYISLYDHPTNEEVVIYSLIDEKEKINEEDYRYYFANRYNIK